MLRPDHFAAIAQAAGCPKDQMHNFVRAGVILQARQLAASAAARLCDRSDGPSAVGFGGARGGGKSFWLLAQMGVDDCQRFPGLKCLLLRKVGKANLENFEDFRRRLFRRLPHEFATSYGTLTFANGSRIFAGHFQNEKDIDAYLGLEYDVIGVEEATTLTARKYQDITTCCRSSKPGWRPRLYSTANPGGIGHAWYRKQFIVPGSEHSQRLSESRVGVKAISPGPVRNECRPGATFSPTGGEGRDEEVRGPLHSCWDGRRDTIFIPARVGDNAFTNPEYRKVLERLGGWQKRAWLDGDWDIAAGQFFTTFRREVHVLDDFDDMRARQWFAALDYGFAHYTVALLGCRDGDGNTFIVDEHAARSWLPRQHAEAIRAMVARHAMNGVVAMRGLARLSMRSQVEIQSRPLALSDLQRFVAGTDVFSRQSDGSTIARQYSREGITLRPANMDRVNGWAEILQRLGAPNAAPAGPAGLRPTLFIHRRCQRLIETLPALQHDPNHPEDVLKVDADEDGGGGDDAADALRYLLATRRATLTMCKLRGL